MFAKRFWHILASNAAFAASLQAAPIALSQEQATPPASPTTGGTNPGGAAPPPRFSPSPTAAPLDRVSIGEKGTLLIYPLIEIRYDGAVNVKQDTFIQLSNDFGSDVHIVAYFVADDCSRHHFDFDLTHSQPVFWSAENGLPVGLAPLASFSPPHPDPLDDDLVVRGALVLFAANDQGQAIRWNHLTGTATIISYALGTAWEYPPYAFQALTAPHGQPINPPGELRLDGVQLQRPYNRLLYTFTAYKSTAFSGGSRMLRHDGLLALMIADLDLRQDWAGPERTKVVYEVHNGEEISFQAEHCLTCWQSLRLSQLGGIFEIENLVTNHGKARIDGVGSAVCPESGDHALLGVSAKLIEFDNGQVLMTGSALAGMGVQSAVIRYDIPPPPEESAKP
ncbi:MAG: hypothetical protein LC135_08015 [Phycisphaerae bacterium]|nr:hypothetical protein [Phycisphaerae bacterium]MCZ2399799.1 hypothetical protein [Phycisphaerae bacterium]